MPVVDACHYCDAPATSVDHVIPRSLGGPNTAWNRVPACHPCNTAKDSMPYETFTGRPLPASVQAEGIARTSDFDRAAWDARREARAAKNRARAARRQQRLSFRIGDHPAWVCVTPDAAHDPTRTNGPLSVTTSTFS